ncbi:peptidase M61 domain protein [Emticicia oligotrophica DSM 17448]|uniref:Peptidase M61 domain protein n=1 Tax=Emticicia oligotrophica (strain DSM 17448 / CIP 109782 / MTCC 6937 / GPTSA100-15) TaxID=929562 RepID=A0ABM5N7F7_EMTOG|nr:PDZ domain-containing protein [Emticicia oligotrophica]AFK05317.1 peptidase M61 domain protein [Emticicia oligotrophica DSM 17448]
MKKAFLKNLILTLVLVTYDFAFSKSLKNNSSNQIPKTNIHYELSMSEPWTHYFEVSMTLSDIDKIDALNKKDFVDFKMPVWTPGSYLVREYAKNVESVKVSDGKKDLKFDKINKNTWRVFGKHSKIIISYKVYAFELSVRNSFLDDSHGYLNGASMFLYIPELKMSPSILTIKPYKNWNTISTGLKRISETEFLYFSPDFDILVDSPIEIGTHKVLTFKALGIPHSIALYSNAPLLADEKLTVETFKRVTEAAASVVGEHPCEDYTFIIHQLPGIGGGLEHLNSTTCQTSPTAYINEASMKNSMSLIAHEYFHLWNIKRIRPIALGPFDYDNENYTHMLWVSEGMTSFYADNILLRAGILTPDEYIKREQIAIGSIENQPGNTVQAVTESSWDAWIKYYRQNENSKNSTISYYDKGDVLGALLNLYIIGETKGEKSLDDVFKYLWNEYYKKQKRGFKDDEFQKACELVAGINMDNFFNKHIWRAEPIDYNAFYKYVGLELIKESESNNPFWGFSLQNNKITSIQKGTSAYDYGLNVNDEILEINGVKGANPSNSITDKKVGDKINVKVKRFGQEFTYEITLKGNPNQRFKLEKVQNPTPEQERLYKKWLFIK